MVSREHFPSMLIPGLLVFFACLCIFLGIASQHMSEITDDAFISFRYARHFADGEGLVFNEGERVEGYTNFLWVLTMAAGRKAGFSLPGFSQTVSILCAALLIIILILFSRNYFSSLPFPYLSYIAPLMLSLNPLYWEHIGTGLETLLFALLMFSSVAVYLIHKNRNWLPYLTGLLLGLGYLTRPEAVMWVSVVVFADILAAILEREGLTRQVIRTAKYIGVFVLIVLLHLAWRVSYYGEFLPNTFYAKATSNWAWGVTYTRGFLLSTGFLPLFAICAGPIFLRRKWALCMSGIIALLLLYNLQIGGDFIFTGRFLFPVLPLIYLLGQEVFRSTLIMAASSARPLWHKTLLPVILGGLIVVSFLFGAGREWNVAKGHVEQNRSMNSLTRLIAECILENTYSTDVIAIVSVGIVPYYSERKTIDMLGLNDWHIARHGIIDKTCFVGHQRTDSDYVLDRKPRIILVKPQDPSTHFNAASRHMLKNPRFHELYYQATWNCSGARFRAFIRREKTVEESHQMK